MQPLTNPVAKDVRLTLGLVSLTVNVHTTVADMKDAPTHQACNNQAHALTRVRQTLACPDCGNDDKTSFIRVREIGKQLTPVQAEWLAEQAAEAAKFKQAMPITVHPAEQVAAALIPNGKSYYMVLKPGSHPTAWGAYNTIAAMIAARPEVTFMTKLTFRTSLQLFTLTASDGMILMHAMADSEMVRERPAIEDVPVIKTDLVLGMQVIDASLEDFDMALHGSTGREKLAERLTEAAPAAASEVVDISGDLTAILRAKKVPAKKVPAKAIPIKAATKKAATKKAATPRKTAARKAS